MSLSYFRITKQSAPKKLKYIFLYKVCLSKYSIKKYKCTGFISLFWKRFAYGKVLFSFNLWHFFLEFNFFFTGFLYSRTNIQMDMNLMLLCGKYSVVFLYVRWLHWEQQTHPHPEPVNVTFFGNNPCKY